MLLRFRVENHASLRDEVELTLIAADGSGEGQIATRPVPGASFEALPALAVFGANASGKSNLLNALGFMREAVVDSHRNWPPGGRIPRRPFMLDARSRARPSTFAVDLVVGGVRYEYGFALGDTQVVGEWLYSYPEQRRRMLFERDADGIRYGSGFTGRRKVIEDVVRPNSLFLSAGASNNHQLLAELYRWFSKELTIATDGDYSGRMAETIRILVEDGASKALLESLMRFADLGIEGMEVIDPRLEPAPVFELGSSWLVDLKMISERAAGRPPRGQVELVHLGADGPMRLDLADESSGTRTWVGLLGPVVGTLEAGNVLVVDELDARLHPLLAARLIALFQNPLTNPRAAQIVFNTHDATLLAPQSAAALRRDQVWLTEKSTDGGTTLTPLLDFQVRRDGAENLEKRYLGGRFGGLPFFDDDLLDGISVEQVTGESGVPTAE